MPIYDPRGGFLSTADWTDLERKIIEGDGYGWPGDPRMELRIGILKQKGTGKEGHRLEVWRWNEDGSESRIAHWLPREQHMICYELSRMRVDAPGHVDVLDRIDAHNAKVDQGHADKYHDLMGGLMEYALHLQHDRTQPKHTFYGMGRTDKPLNVMGAKGS